MKTAIVFFIIFFLAYAVHAEDGHHLWLRCKSTGSVIVRCSQKSKTLTLAQEELQQGWQGKDGSTMLLEVKHSGAIKNDGFRLSATCIQANTDRGILYG